MSTEQQETREQRLADIVAVTGHAEWCEHEDPESQCICNAFGHAAALIDGPVSRMIADAEQAAERRGAVKALREAGDYLSNRSLRTYFDHRADAIENGADL